MLVAWAVIPVRVGLRAAPAVPVATAAPRGDDGAAGTSRDKDDAPKGPTMPTAIPDGATLPPPTEFAKSRPDVLVGRIAAVERVLGCAPCQGTGAVVTRHRVPSRTFDKPDIYETSEPCKACKGTGLADLPARVSPVLHGLVSQMGRLPADSPAAPRLFERIHAVLERLGATGDMAQRMTAEDRNELLAERMPKVGSAITVTGIAGKAFGGAGARIVPVMVDGRALVLLRAPLVNYAVERRDVLAGGVVAGEVAEASWEHGRVIVLDGGFAVPHVDATVLPAAAEAARKASQAGQAAGAAQGGGNAAPAGKGGR